MINLKLILEILAMDDWYGQDEDIQIAKGKYKTPMTFKDLKDRIKRA
jgi:hypothetical protein